MGGDPLLLPGDVRQYSSCEGGWSSSKERYLVCEIDG